MEKRNINQLELIGMSIIYIITSLYMFSLLVSLFRIGTLDIEEYMLFFIALSSLVITILYHLRVIKNYLLVGIIGIFTGVIVGGLFILIGHDKE